MVPKSPIRKLFQDSELQKRFVADGFVVVPLISASEVRTLLNLFESTRPPGEITGLHTTFYDSSLQDCLLVHGLVTQIFARHVQRLFRDCTLVGGSFFVKGTTDSVLVPHQDWNAVDESAHTSMSIWCPLVDVDAHNGPLWVVRGSHHRWDTVRSITIPSKNFSVEEIAPFSVELLLRAGEAVIYAHDLFHASPPNVSGRIRPAVVAGVLPTEADNIHYYRPPGSTEPIAEVLRIDNSFYYARVKAYHTGERPDFVSLGTKTFDPIGPTLEDLRRCTLE